ncbi:MAG: hypothetical protein BGN86_00905 [Caulobacterales bacterium 68-7]|nr:MAG: hypothetical protein BGN86_00905 [Caulobacterales bacterium 68-7]
MAGWLARAPRAALLELVSRIGFLARGVVYVSVGALALLAAFDLTPHAGGAVSAMASWGRWPAGVALIWLTATGLVGFATWRFLQAVFDADGHGHALRGLVVRAGQAVSGAAHAILAWSLFGLLDGLEDLNEAGDQDAAQSVAAAVLAWPHGDMLLIGSGGAILVFAVGSVCQGLFQAFAKRLGCSPVACRWAVSLARLGYVGRGLALAPMGVFLAEAGFDARAASARDFAGALQVVEDQPFGTLVLGLAAVGLIAFGLFAVFEAGFRRIVLDPAAW